MNGALFQLQDLGFAYPGQLPLLQGLSLTIDAGEKILLRGANGCGKSTFLKLLAGILKPQAGTLLLRNKPPSEQSPKAFRELVFCRQKASDNLFGLTPGHDLEAWRLAWPERFGEKSVRNLDDPLMDMLDVPYGKLSAGELRACTLMWLPLLRDKFWLLDEPTANLDAGRQIRFAEMCAAKVDGGFLIVSHSPALPAGIFDRVLFLANGNLRERK